MIARFIHRLINDAQPWDGYVDILAALPDNF